MRSDLVFGAMRHVSNRFLLTRVAANATRKFHRPNTRIQDTANEVFERFRRANPLALVSCIGTLQPFVRLDDSLAVRVMPGNDPPYFQRYGSLHYTVS